MISRQSLFRAIAKCNRPDTKGVIRILPDRLFQLTLERSYLWHRQRSMNEMTSLTR